MNTFWLGGWVFACVILNIFWQFCLETSRWFVILMNFLSVWHFLFEIRCWLANFYTILLLLLSAFTACILLILTFVWWHPYKSLRIFRFICYLICDIYYYKMQNVHAIPNVPFTFVRYEIWVHSTPMNIHTLFMKIHCTITITQIHTHIPLFLNVFHGLMTHPFSYYGSLFTSC